ncbi:MAG TPA: cellulose synthase operon protein YhjQ/BcsQ [Acetobacteraceae bacterium]|nr:cellulose synthase operon protein YhjQ/BcsQ [Acetobacteraceae bacterium]
MPLICFASPKGGVGKTTLAANAASDLARAGHDVIALDLDPQNALRLHFGVRPGDPEGFIATLRDQPGSGPDRKRHWREALRPTGQGVELLAYGQTDFSAALAFADELAVRPDLLAGPVREMLEEPGRVVVVDTMPGASAQIASILPFADLVVTVLLVDAMSIALIASVQSGRAYGQALPGEDDPRLFYALNQFDRRTRLGSAIAAAAARKLGGRLLATIYRDENVAEAGAAQRMIGEYAPTSRAAGDIRALAGAIASRLPVPRARRLASLHA